MTNLSIFIYILSRSVLLNLFLVAEPFSKVQLFRGTSNFLIPIKSPSYRFIDRYTLSKSMIVITINVFYLMYSIFFNFVFYVFFSLLNLRGSVEPHFRSTGLDDLARLLISRRNTCQKKLQGISHLS